MKKRVVVIFFGFLVASLSIHASAARLGGFYKIWAVKSSELNYGGCAAFLDPDPKLILPNCANRWVTFDCKGSFAAAGSTKSGGADSFSNAQAGWITQRTAFVEIEDSQTADGYCWALRVDLYKEGFPGVPE